MCKFNVKGDEEDETSSLEEPYIEVNVREKQIATPPAITKELGERLASIKASKTWRERAPEIRAVIRNERAFDARVELNQAIQSKDTKKSTQSRAALAALVKEHGYAFKAAEMTVAPKKHPKKLKAAQRQPPLQAE